MSVSSSSEAYPVWRLPEVAEAPLAFRTLLRKTAENWTTGVLAFVTPEGREVVIRGAHPGPRGELRVKNYRFVGRLLAGGDVGFAEGYMAGEWDTPDLAALLEAVSRNYDKVRGLARGNVVSRTIGRLRQALRANSRAGSRKNIHAHYDLGNAFYEQWLDPSMTYSSARFDEDGESLETAQRRKYESLARAMDLRPGQHVLEIGCGWGGFAEYAATAIGARVTGITISRAQYDYAKKRLFLKGLAERTDVRLVDYRDVDGRYDRVASIEMFEAVGEEYWPAYFGKIRDVLEPDGAAALQIITIDDRHFEEYRRRADFIQTYVFPGGVLPSERRLREETARGGLSWEGVQRFGQSYADTLAEWRRRFDGAWDGIAPLGFDERFRRLWRFYLAYCEAGFRTGRTDVIQLALRPA